MRAAQPRCGLKRAPHAALEGRTRVRLGQSCSSSRQPGPDL